MVSTYMYGTAALTTSNCSCRHARAVAQAIAAITTLASSGGGSTPGWGKHSLNEHVDRAVTETEIVKAALSHRDGQVRKAACSLLTALSSHRREALRRVCAAMPDKLLGTLADKDPVSLIRKQRRKEEKEDSQKPRVARADTMQCDVPFDVGAQSARARVSCKMLAVTRGRALPAGCLCERPGHGAGGYQGVP